MGSFNKDLSANSQWYVYWGFNITLTTLYIVKIYNSDCDFKVLGSSTYGYVQVYCVIHMYMSILGIMTQLTANRNLGN